MTNVIEWESSNILWSGDDNGKLNIWDIRTFQFPVKTIQIGQPNDDVNSICILTPDEGFVACANKIIHVDIRMETKCSTIMEAGDDINQIDIHAKSNTLVAGDDNGTVSVYDFKKNRMKSQMNHTNICSSVLFRPGSSWEYVVSGGLDQQIIYWNVPQGKPRVRPVIVQPYVDPTTSEDADQSGAGIPSLNPPMVVRLVASRSKYAIGLGDGTIGTRCFEFQSVQHPFERRFVAHRGTICALGQVGNGDDGLLRIVSSGIDRVLKLWEVRKDSESMLKQWEGIKSSINWISVLNDTIALAAAEAEKPQLMRIETAS